MYAKIYRPAKSVMQSGNNKSRSWKLEFAPSSSQYIEPLMKWTGSCDTRQQVCLFFPTREQAIKYATTHNIRYIILQEHQRTITPKSYADNFTRLRGI
ncbi:NADH-ubiquinone oxidoreductase [Ehrlichia ruminantium]|uniref:NADH-ubiquinone oxidoreductase n=1 Tax=Ehrlichia ruminantium TaxID=779 RepID=A0AAE6UIR2_EHRRU|nr:ETC complex I subunit [Ehrlichia ruminantium]QGR02823.1 NADH-ubiquinone oxidoreductase [Ehrlichia ruminantium]QGR03747.1 NADH-ubiquinone oxidoreductase [Ehrlichia ruminantium]QGR04674.1 NADH-ubiquinone oxidoreductase [Ehrlichia ruminantium]